MNSKESLGTPPATTAVRRAGQARPRAISSASSTIKPGRLLWIASGMVLALLAGAPRARANVYATNIKLNGGMANVSVGSGTNVTISYRLNEAATNVLVKIFSGTNVVRTLSLSGNTPGAGTTRGTNTVVWDGKDNNQQLVAGGAYSVSITAASAGYPVWTQITLDNTNGTSGDPGTYVYDGHGIAVDVNTNSPYYGRILIANAFPNGTTLPGDRLGIIKCNADASFADEGAFSDGGYAWSGGYDSPWKVRISDDDYVYIDDFSSDGLVYRWDPTISTNSQFQVLGTTNWADATIQLSGPTLWGSSTNTELWMVDQRPGSTGVRRFQLAANGACSNADVGTVVVGAGGDLDLNTSPFEAAIGRDHSIYVIQAVDENSAPAAVLKFPAYDPGTNGGTPELIATNTAGSDDPNGDWCQGRAIALDPTGTYLLASFLGGSGGNGDTKVLRASDLSVVTNLDLGIVISGQANHSDTACAWDAVGNAYYIEDDSNIGVWRAVSPPGPNQATTTALAHIQVASQPFYITNITVRSGMVILDFVGPSGDSPSIYTVLNANTPNGAYTAAPGAIVTGANGVYRATLPQPANSVQFYRILRSTGASLAPHITAIHRAGQTVTLNFTGAASDPAADFVVLAASNLGGTFLPAGATLTGANGSYQATLTDPAPFRLYRIKR